MDGAHGPDHPESSAKPGKPHRSSGGSLYLRATLSQWQQSYREVTAGAARAARPTAPATPGDGGAPTSTCLSEASMHAVLARLRLCADAAALFERYEASPAAEFALIASLLPLNPEGEAEHLYALCYVREAAYWLRWLELQRAGGSATGSANGHA